MKIVISSNSCYELPFEVINKYFELSGMGKPYFYEQKGFDYILVQIPTTDYFIVSKKYIGKETKDNDLFKEDVFFDANEIKRNDINLVESVEELKPIDLKVVEIPDDVDWYIYESESGSESIHESHRVWF